MKNTFKKYEHLKRKRYFDALFYHGKSVKFFPLRVIFLPFTQEDFPNISDLPTNSQAGFSVPKKRFKKAVDRNHIKRLMREAYRLNKHILNKNYAMLFIYLDHEKSDFERIEKSVTQILNNMERM